MAMAIAWLNWPGPRSREMNSKAAKEKAKGRRRTSVALKKAEPQTPAARKGLELSRTRWSHGTWSPSRKREDEHMVRSSPGSHIALAGIKGKMVLRSLCSPHHGRASNLQHSELQRAHSYACFKPAATPQSGEPPCEAPKQVGRCLRPQPRMLQLTGFFFSSSSSSLRAFRSSQFKIRWCTSWQARQ
eukprot:COSAG04_NODE_5435_length_1621_cov_2.145204_1_plen_186_part_10